MKNVYIILLTLAMGSSYTVSAQAIPDASAATGFIVSFKNFEKDSVSVGTSTTASVTNGTLTVTVPAAEPHKAAVINLYDVTASNEPLVMNFSEAIYVKLKAPYGTFIKVYPINVNQQTMSDSGFAARQKVVCSSGAQWYKFDYTGVLFTDISQIAIQPDFTTSKLSDVTFSIDSVLIGNTNYTPHVQPYQVPRTFTLPLTTLSHYYALGSDSATLVPDGIKLHFTETIAANRGINFKINSGSGDDRYIDITDIPYVVIGYKDASNDTLKVNFKYGSANTLVYNLQNVVINGTGTTTIDFSGIAFATFDEVSEFQLFLNNERSGKGTIVLTQLQAGEENISQNCTTPSVNVSDPKLREVKSEIYPNPASAGEALRVGEDFSNVEILNLNGNTVASLNVDQNHVWMPQHLKPGMYVMVMKGKQLKSHTKLQIK